MDKQSWQISFRLDPQTIYAAMILGGRSIFVGRWRLLPIVQGVILSLLAPLGLVGWIMIGSELMGEGIAANALWIPVVFMLSALAFLGLSRVMYRHIAKASARARFNRESHVTLTSEAITITTLDSVWRTGWADIDQVVRSGKVIALILGGIVLPLPVSAFADEADADAAFVAMQYWHNKAGIKP